MKTIVKKVTPKKTAKKAAVKKIVQIPVTGETKKSVTTKKIAPSKKGTSATLKKLLVVSSNYNSFWMNDGQILNSLVALKEALKNMDTVVYKYHTAHGRHDFANWVEDVLKDAPCATALRKNKTPKAAHTTVVKFLAEYRI